MKNRQSLEIKARLNNLSLALSSLKSQDEVQAVLADLCTPAELEAMADRWLVVAYLKKGDSYREIQKKTLVSLTTITRVARILQFGAGGYDLLCKRLKK